MNAKFGNDQFTFRTQKIALLNYFSYQKSQASPERGKNGNVPLQKLDNQEEGKPINRRMPENVLLFHTRNENYKIHVSPLHM